jgi:hypothetical protein
MQRIVLGCLLSLLVSGIQAADTNSGRELLAPYFGNTFISLHDDGTQYIVFWNADGTFSLTRRGGAEPGAGYTMHGTYTIENSRSCFPASDAPKDAPGCVPVERDKMPGTAWDVNGRIHEIHMILPGRLGP